MSSSREGSPPLENFRERLSRHHTVATTHPSKLRHVESASRLDDSNPRPLKRRRTETDAVNDHRHRDHDGALTDSSDSAASLMDESPKRRSRKDDGLDEEREVLRELVGSTYVTPSKRPRGRPRKHPKPEDCSPVDKRLSAREAARATFSYSNSEETGSDSEDSETSSESAATTRREVRRAREPPPPPITKYFSFRPNPAMFAAKKLRGPVMVLREEISDIEVIEEDEEDEDDGSNYSDQFGSDRMSLDQDHHQDSIPVVAWMPRQGHDRTNATGSDDDGGEHGHQFLRRITGRKRSRSSGRSGESENDSDPVKHTVRRSFGLWHSGNPQGFATRRREVDPSADIPEEPFVTPQKSHRRQQSVEATPPPPTPYSKDPVVPLKKDKGKARLQAKLDLYQRPRSHSMGHLMQQMELEKAKKQLRSSTKPKIQAEEVTKSRAQFSTYTNQPRSHVRLKKQRSRDPVSGRFLNHDEGEDSGGREEENWIKARPPPPQVLSLRQPSLDALNPSPRRPMHRSMTSFPAYGYSGREELTLDADDDYDAEENPPLRYDEFNYDEDEDGGREHSDRTMQDEAEARSSSPKGMTIPVYTLRSSRGASHSRSADHIADDHDSFEDSGLKLDAKLPRQRRREEVCY